RGAPRSRRSRPRATSGGAASCGSAGRGRRPSGSPRRRPRLRGLRRACGGTSPLGDHPLAMAITFRLMTREDYPLLLEWHGRPHVERWWTKRTTMEDIEEHYGPTIDGADPTDHYIALLDGEPIGMIQAYLIADYPDWAELTGEGEG